MTGEKNVENKMELRFPAISANEGFARICAAAFASQLDPTLEEIADIKTAISEAVTNAIVHAYEKKGGQVILRGKLDEKGVHFEIEDAGRGIPNLEEAMQPFYTTCSGEERSGMGFTVMQTFMDELHVFSEPRKGTRVCLYKKIEN